MSQDAVTVGLTPQGHLDLQRLKGDGVFSEMIDAYRFAIGLAVRRRLLAPADLSTVTIFNIGSLDRDGMIRDLIISIYEEAKDRPYAFVERLAEAGFEELIQLHSSRQLRISELFELTGAEQES